MQSVYMHQDGNGVSWAIARCSTCGEVHKYLAEIASAGPVICQSCHHAMRLQGAVVEAAGGQQRPSP